MEKINLLLFTFKNLINKFKIQYLLASFLLIVAPIQTFMILVGLAILTDFIFGIWKAIKLKRKITSNALSRTIVKMFIYQLVLIGTFLIDANIINELVKMFIDINLLITKLISLSLLYIEATSINENIEESTGINIYQSIGKTIKESFKFKKTLKEFND